jgi:hypothetical protein
VPICPFSYAATLKDPHEDRNLWYCTSDCELWTEHGCSIKLLASNSQNGQALVKSLEKWLEAVEINIYFKESKPSSERLSQ